MFAITTLGAPCADPRPDLSLGDLDFCPSWFGKGDAPVRMYVLLLGREEGAGAFQNVSAASHLPLAEDNPISTRDPGVECSDRYPEHCEGMQRPGGPSSQVSLRFLSLTETQSPSHWSLAS